jgi:hypothetical protein
MDIKTASHFGLLREVVAGDIVTHYSAATGEPTTFEVIALLPCNTNAVVMLDTTIGPVQALAGTPVEIFDGFDSD